MSKVNKIAEEYTVSPEEAAEIIRMVEEGVYPSESSEGSPEGTQTPQSEDQSTLQNVDQQIRETEDEYLNTEMHMNEAYQEGNQEGFQQFQTDLGNVAAKLRQLKSSRKKIALDMNPQEMERSHDSTTEVSQIVESQGDLDDSQKGEVVGLATNLMSDPTMDMSPEEAVDAARLQVNNPVNAARAYAFIRNLDKPLACPKCSSKVARSEESPRVFVCKKGHLSEMTFQRVASDPFGEPSQRENYDEGVGEGFDEKMDDFYYNQQQSDPKGLVSQIQRYVGNPEISDQEKIDTIRGLLQGKTVSKKKAGPRDEILEAPSQEAQPAAQPSGEVVPEGGGNPLENMGEQEKNRLREALRNASSNEPLHTLGVIDGLLQTDYFSSMASSDEESQIYQYGAREGESAMGGYSS